MWTSAAHRGARIERAAKKEEKGTAADETKREGPTEGDQRALSPFRSAALQISPPSAVRIEAQRPQWRRGRRGEGGGEGERTRFPFRTNEGTEARGGGGADHRPFLLTTLSLPFSLSLPFFLSPPEAVPVAE